MKLESVNTKTFSRKGPSELERRNFHHCDTSRIRSPPYGLHDLLGEEKKGSFYEQELQRVIKGDDDKYSVEKSLKTKRWQGKLEDFVKWQGGADKFDSSTTEVHGL
jgi:hypothetical protein